MSGPLWMYRKGEAKLFASPEDVPAGEGWQDTPVAVEIEEEVAEDAPPARKRRKSQPDDETAE